jgi:hypothetical protein
MHLNKARVANNFTVLAKCVISTTSIFSCHIKNVILYSPFSARLIKESVVDYLSECTPVLTDCENCERMEVVVEVKSTVDCCSLTCKMHKIRIPSLPSQMISVPVPPISFPFHSRTPTSKPVALCNVCTDKNRSVHRHV